MNIILYSNGKDAFALRVNEATQYHVSLDMWIASGGPCSYSGGQPITPPLHEGPAFVWGEDFDDIEQLEHIEPWGAARISWEGAAMWWIYGDWGKEDPGQLSTGIHQVDEIGNLMRCVFREAGLQMLALGDAATHGGHPTPDVPYMRQDVDTAPASAAGAPTPTKETP